MSVMNSAVLSPGYHPLPEGHIANVVTCLEMTAKPELRRVPAVEGTYLKRMRAGGQARLFMDWRTEGDGTIRRWFIRSEDRTDYLHTPKTCATMSSAWRGDGSSWPRR